MKTLICILAILVTFSLVAGCSGSDATATPPPTGTTQPTDTDTPSPTATPKPTDTPIPPTDTPTPTATPTPTPTPTLSTLEGEIFFDMNASGLLDESTGIVGEGMIHFFPELAGREGDVVTVTEPGLEGIEVCATVSGNHYCDMTDGNGNYEISGLSVEQGARVSINISDPNAGNPITGMRFINDHLGKRILPPYSIHGYQVGEQDLNITSITPIEEGISLTTGCENQTGLTQSFLTLPFSSTEQPNPKIWNFYDILDIQEISPDHPFQADDNVALNYDGSYSGIAGGDPINPAVGVQNGHNGLDYSIPIGTSVLHAGPSGKVINVFYEEGRQVMVWVEYDVGDERYLDTYAHLQVPFVKAGDPISRGQVLGLSGNSGSSPYHQLHFDLIRQDPGDEAMFYKDPYRAIVELIATPVNFSGSTFSFWTVDNSPQHSR